MIKYIYRKVYMAFMEWKDTLSVKIPEFDEAHKKLFNLINDLHSAMKQGKGKDIVAPILAELKNYTHQHFSQEEAFLEKHNYVELVPHQEAHKKFMEKVAGLEKDLEGGKFTVVIDLLDFLKDWLTEHIQVIDLKYSILLAGKNL